MDYTTTSSLPGRTLTPRMCFCTIVSAGALLAGLFVAHRASAAALNPYEAAVLANSPLMYYTFNDANSSSGTTVLDTGSNGNNGTYRDNIVQVQGPHGLSKGSLPTDTAFRNTGATNTSIVAGSTLGTFGSSMGDADGFTVEFWVNTTDKSSNQQFGRLELSNSTALVIDFNRAANGGGFSAGTTSFYLRSNGSEVLSQSINTDIYDGRWHHVVYAVDNAKTNTMRIYVDGQQKTPTATTTGMVVGSTFSNFTAGALNTGIGWGGMSNRDQGAATHFKGAVDDVAIYGTALSAAQVQARIAALPTYKYSYDGTYVPTSSSPALTQTTWQIASTGAVGTTTITHNTAGPTPSAAIGFARFNDTTNLGRVAMYQPINPVDQLEASVWTYEARLKIDSYSGNTVFLGMRDEGGNGKIVTLGWDATTHALAFYNARANTVLQPLSAADFADGQYHVYRVVKYLAQDGFRVQAYLDGAPLLGTPMAYSAFPNDDNLNLSNNGLGLFSATPGLVDLTLDYFSLTLTVPEPSSSGLLLAGLGALVVRRNRRRR